MSRCLQCLCLVPLALLCGCGPRPIGPVPPGLDPEKYAYLQIHAARDMNCTPEQLTYERFGEGRHLFKGCGQQQERYLEPWFTSEAAANRFSKELKCDIKTTTEERIDADTHVVEGCGQRITYVRVCNGGCKWIANLGTTTK